MIEARRAVSRLVDKGFETLASLAKERDNGLNVTQPVPITKPAPWNSIDFQGTWFISSCLIYIC